MKTLLLPLVLAVLALPAAAIAPELKARHAKAPDGYAPDRLAENLDLTASNMNDLIAYIQPRKAGVPAPAGKELDAALKRLDAEAAAAAELVKQGDLLLAKGIVRNPLGPGSDEYYLMYRRPGMRRNEDPTDLQRRLIVATLQANVAGRLGTLIGLKLINPPHADIEASTEHYLEVDRKTLAAVQKP